VHGVHYGDHKIFSFDFFVTIWILHTLPHHISWKTTSTSNFHLFLGLPVGLYHWRFSTQIFSPIYHSPWLILHRSSPIANFPNVLVSFVWSFVYRTPNPEATG
jgi:hypothetical protein